MLRFPPALGDDRMADEVCGRQGHVSQTLRCPVENRQITSFYLPLLKIRMVVSERASLRKSPGLANRGDMGHPELSSPDLKMPTRRFLIGKKEGAAGWPPLPIHPRTQASEG